MFLDSSYQKAAVVIKHTNPCGVAIGKSPYLALKRALDSDRVSAFGGIIAINCPVDEAAAKELENIFIECIVAPYFDNNAKEILSKKKNLRLLELNADSIHKADKNHIKSILGGLLIQDLDEPNTDQKEWKNVTMEGPQFSTLAESNLYRSWNADVIGMTNMPEAKLAREAEICYISLSMVTDFDCWHPNHENVEVSDIINVLNKNSKNAQSLIKSFISLSVGISLVTFFHSF